MAFDAITRCAGLITQYNPLTMPPGALAKANDCIITRENIVQDRRGYASYGTVTNNIKAFLTYSSRILAHNGNKLSYDNGSGTFADYSGTYDPPTSQTMRFLEANNNLYVTTDSGVKVFTDVAGTAGVLAGAPRGLDPVLSLVTGSILVNQGQYAYRTVWVKVDPNANQTYGYPSQRTVITNLSGSSKAVQLVITIPSGITTSDILQIYRTTTATGVLATTTDAGDDTMNLVYQSNPTSSEVSAGSLTITDNLIDELQALNAPLYTNANQEGILQGSSRPPLAYDIALYSSNYLVYANTTSKQRLFTTLISTSGLSGDTFVLAGVTYTFGVENTATGTIGLSATGVVSYDLAETAKSMVKVINRYASNTSVYAYYLSGPTDLPGRIMIEERGLGASAFTFTTSSTDVQAAFFPNPPTSGTTAACTSSNDRKRNAIFYSKSQQLEAVPDLNYIIVGSANESILRVVGLRDSLIVIKENSVWRITGENPSSFVATLIDSTVSCKGADTVVAMANQVYMLSNQGVVAVSDSGVQVVSREIEPNLIPQIGFSTIATTSAGASYESERSYFLSIPQTSSETSASQIYVFNSFTKTWVRWTFGFKAAIVGSGDKLYFAKPNSPIIYRERKTFSDDDYRDPEFSGTITSISGSSVTFTISSGTPIAGWQISQGSTAIAIDSITVSAGTYTAIMSETPPSSWTTGACTIYPSVGMEVEWHAWSGGGPAVGMLKQVRQIAILSDNIDGNNSASDITITVRSNLDLNIEELPVAIAGGAWGSGAWGAFPWGGSGDPYGYPTLIPRNKSYCRLLNVGVKHTNAGEKLVCAGLAFAFEVFGENINR